MLGKGYNFYMNSKLFQQVNGCENSVHILIIIIIDARFIYFIRKYLKGKKNSYAVEYILAEQHRILCIIIQKWRAMFGLEPLTARD